MPTSTVVDLFERSPASFVFDDATLDAGQLLGRARRIATGLSDAGVAAGDRVAVRLPNSVDHVVLLLAGAIGGWASVAVNTRFTDADAESLIRRSGAHRIAPDADWSTSSPTDRAGHPDDPFIVFTTSGTTGPPKMVLHAQRSIAEHAGHAAAACGLTVRDVALVAMPLCGTFGLTSFMSAVAGAGRIVVTDFDVDRVARLIAEHRVTVTHGSDDMFHRLLEHGADLSSIRLGGCARFNSSLDGVIDRGASAGARLVGLYGMSEVQALFTVRDPSAPGHGRAGGTLAGPTARYRVVDDHLEVRGPSLMRGYLAEGGASVDDELTGRHIVDGWFRTGDIAIAETDRSFEFVTRAGDAMRLGGFLVDPSEIESVLTDLAGIDAAQVVAVERPSGNRPVAFVVGRADEAATIAACRARLAIHQVPVRVVTLDEFPVTAGPNGTKIRRDELRRHAETLEF